MTIRRRNDEPTPEMRLVLAVFEDAIRAASNPAPRTRRQRREQQEARNWVQDDDRAWPFAFANVCDLLGLDAGAVRRRIFLGRVFPEADGRRTRHARARYAGVRAASRDEHPTSAQRATATCLASPS
jgi:hypothetical protein